MQLTPPARPDPDVVDLGAALRGATAQVGAGPAITVLFPQGRQEQGMASLAQWAAKGAHLLELDAMLAPGDTIGLDAPLSWTSAAVCLAAWWAGIAVSLDGEADVTVVHEDRDAPATGGDNYVLGDGIDGGPVGNARDEPWVRAVQTFPDQPPLPRGSADAVALRANQRTWTQQDLLEEARRLAPGSGTVGVDATETDRVVGLIAVAVRPLTTFRPTVILRGVEHAAADGDRVAAWIEC